MSENSFELTFKEVTTQSGLFCQFDHHHGVLLLDVKNSFTNDDFKVISDIIEPYFVEHGSLCGVIIHSKKFPRWSDAQNRREYINFAQNNHYKFKKAALSMGGFFTKIIVRIAKGRVHPEVKTFKYNQVEDAQKWVLGGKAIPHS